MEPPLTSENMKLARVVLAKYTNDFWVEYFPQVELAEELVETEEEMKKELSQEFTR